ncbi:ABC transporter ATP-binding protein [Leptolyngbya sp. FACHB-261]|nr:ABC transporter ATP-binding protein [Leptolyngbya sp. FACHB-261]
MIATETVTKTQDQEVVLSVQNISKKFCRDLSKSLFYGTKDMLTELVGGRRKSDTLRKGEFWSLSNVSFQLRRGETLGLVGSNGAGKSTLLRVLSGLIRPDVGLVEVNGRLAPLIALGAGFNPVLTGRENIYANMSILGLANREINERFDAVVEFAEIGHAIDAPVQSYSSGMAARLGFSCAIHTEPDILLIDEVLAVGDSRFRAKCLRKLHELRQKQTAFILVSHNAHTILTVCESAIYLKKGAMITAGETPAVVNQYEKDLFFDGVEKGVGPKFFAEKPESESTGLDITGVVFRNGQGEIVEAPVSGEPAYIGISCKARRKLENVGASLVIKGLGEGGEAVLLMNSLGDKQVMNFLPGDHEIQVQMPYLGLKLGAYTLDIFLKENGLYALDEVEAFVFTVEGEESVGRGLFYQPREWKVVAE